MLERPNSPTATGTPYWAQAVAAFSSGAAAVLIGVFALGAFGSGTGVQSAAIRASTTSTVVSGQQGPRLSVPAPSDAGGSLVGDGGAATAKPSTAKPASPSPTRPIYEVHGVRFQATFPAAPFRDTGEVVVAEEPRAMAGYFVLGEDGVMYQVAAFQLPPGEELTLDEALDHRMQMPPDVQIVDSRRVQVQGYDGVAYRAEEVEDREFEEEGSSDREPVEVRGLVLIVGRNVVFIQAAGPAPLNTAEAFTDSFRLR